MFTRFRSIGSFLFVAFAASACGNSHTNPAALSASSRPVEVKALCQDATQQFIVKAPKVAAGVKHFQVQASDMGEARLRTVHCVLRKDALSKFSVFRCRDHSDLVDLYTSPQNDLTIVSHVLFYPTTKITRVLCQQLPTATEI